VVGCSTRTGDASRLAGDEKGRDGTLGSTAMSDEAVQPSLGRLGDGDGGNWAEDLGEESGERVRGVEGWEMNGAATTRGRLPELVNDDRRSDGGGAGVAGRASGWSGSDDSTGLERPVRFQLQVRDVARSLLSTEEPISEGGRESVVLFVAVRHRDDELADDRGELGTVAGTRGGPRGSRGA
jgi:hypothetical protein